MQDWKKYLKTHQNKMLIIEHINLFQIGDDLFIQYIISNTQKLFLTLT